MYKLRLIKGLSYNGVVRASKDRPFVCVSNQATADKLVQGGYFTLVSCTEPTADPPVDAFPAGTETDAQAAAFAASADTDTGCAGASAKDDLAGMSKAELIAYAESLGVDISECKNNGERRAALELALDKAAEQEAENGGATVDYS